VHRPDTQRVPWHSDLAPCNRNAQADSTTTSAVGRWIVTQDMDMTSQPDRVIVLKNP
jgi:hypothetical protein